MKESLRILLLVGMVIAIGLLPGRPAECENGPSITKQVDKTSASPGDTLTRPFSLFQSNRQYLYQHQNPRFDSEWHNLH